MNGWFSDDDGNKSMGRLLAFWASIAGSVIIAVGLAVVVLEVVARLGSAQGVGLTGIGAGIMGAGNGAKAWAKRSERVR